MDSQFPQPYLEEGTTYYPLRPTKLYKIKNIHSTDTIDTENSGTRGRPIWVHSSQVGKADSKWVRHVVPAYPNVSPGPMNGSILLRWAGAYCAASCLSDIDACPREIKFDKPPCFPLKLYE